MNEIYIFLKKSSLFQTILNNKKNPEIRKKEHKKRMKLTRMQLLTRKKNHFFFRVENRERERKKGVGGFGEERGKNGDIYKER